MSYLNLGGNLNTNGRGERGMSWNVRFFLKPHSLSWCKFQLTLGTIFFTLPWVSEFLSLFTGPPLVKRVKRRRRRRKHAASLPNYKAITWTGHRLKVKFMRCNKHQPLCVRQTFVLAWLLVTLDLSKKVSASFSLFFPLSIRSTQRRHGHSSPLLQVSEWVSQSLSHGTHFTWRKKK